MGKRTKPRSLPLRYRAPNAPALFVGRAAECAWLGAAIERAPVSLVWGAGGVGKTSLVLRVVADCGGAANAVFVRARPAEPLGTEVARALAAANALRDVDWPELARDREGVLALAIDLAEPLGRWIVLDDVHLAEPEDARETLAALARYARRSRWIATSRVWVDHPVLTGQTLELGGLPESELLALARTAAPRAEAAAVREAARAAGGSPLRLLQSVGGAAGSLDDPLADLDERAADTVRALALVEVPVAAGVLARLPAAPDRHVLALLERRGLLQRSPAGIKLHEVVRATVGAASSDLLRAQMADAMLAGTDAEWIEGLRLSVSLGRYDRADALLEREAARLLELGHARALWQALEPAPSDHLLRWRLRCAVELGEPRILASVRQAPHPSEEDRLAWARTRAALGRNDEALALAAELRALGNATVAAEASMLRALLWMGAARFEEALAELDGLAPPDTGLEARRDALRAGCLVLLGRREDARTVLARLREAWPSLARATRIDIALGVAQSLYALGELEPARAQLERLEDALDGNLLAFRRGRWALALRAVVHLDLGRLREGRRDLDRLGGLVDPTSPLGLTRAVAHAGARLAAGELEGLDDALDATHREAQRAGRTDDVAMVAIMRAELLMLRGVPVPVPEAPPAPRSAVFASMWALTRVIARLRAGERTPVPEPAPHPEPRILHAIAGATGAVAAGTVARSAARAVELATAHGYRVREAEARLACADALALCGRWADVAAEARAVCELGQAMPSARFVEEGRFDAALAEPGIDPAAVERAAQLASTSPVAARRARALLGGAPPLDVVDAAVIAAVERSRGWVRPALVVPARDGGEWAPAWGLDVGRSAVWLPDGRTLDLSRRRLLFALLDALARLGGDASKEELVREVWQLRDYHPLRDDNRLHASIRKLRRALEDEPGSPARLLTTARGYALGGVVRRIA